MAETAAAAFYGVETLLEGAAALAKGIYDPTLPLKATLTPITDIDVPQAYHSLSVVKGRAYMFGGKTTSKDGGTQLADNDVQMIVLPSSGVDGSDYKRLEGKDEKPPRRWGHSAAVVGDGIYVFGGSEEDNGEPMDEGGRVWLFDTASNTWSYLDPPANGSRPEPRIQQACVASEHPRPVQHRTDEGVAPQLPMDPAKVVPEPPAPNSYGTLIVQGGKGKSGQQLNDLWTFDISSRTWSELPEPPSPAVGSPSLAMVDTRLYSFSKGQTSYLDLTPSSFSDKAGQGELGLSPLGPWSSIPSSPESDTNGPGHRIGASLVPVTTGQGRNYLLLIGGSSPTGEALEDLWVLQLKPEGMTAASFKDAARMAIKKDTREMQWEEVKYYDADGKMIQESQDGRGIGARKGFAAARGTEVDGASVVVWGGVEESGRVRGDGLMVTVDR